MNKRTILLFANLLLAGSIYATGIPASLAQKVCTNFYKQNSPKAISSVTLAETNLTPQGAALYYVFNINTNDGFVIVSADNAASPIIGYATTGHYEMQNLSPEFESYMAVIDKEIIDIKARSLPATPSISAEWSDYATGTAHTRLSHRFRSAVAPLSNVVWSQGGPFNGMCPGGCVTGCCATSMAQVMQYWKYPAHGILSNTYNENTPQYGQNYGVLSRNFYNDYYNWANMPDTINAPSNSDVALLMLDCGIAIDMNYNPGGSNAQVICPNAYSSAGADSVSCQTAYTKFFGYNRHTIQGYYKGQFSDTVWTNMMENELNHGRMIQYTGGGDIGHAWVCEGYDSNSYFYMNWGWGGSPNGYFSLKNLNPYGYNFDSLQQALIGIEPPAASAQFIANNISVKSGSSIYFSDKSLTPTAITAWHWQFPGGTPATSSAQNPLVKYNTPGIYNVTLIVTASGGSDTLTRYNYIAVQPSDSLPILQTFSGKFPPKGWYVNNPNGYNTSYQSYGGAWQQYIHTQGGGYGLNDTCMLFNNFNLGYRDYLLNEPPGPNPIGGENMQIYTPAYNFTLVSADSLYFDVAYAPYNSLYSDTLAIYYSLDGGVSWTNIYYKGGAALATAPSISSNVNDTLGFKPTPAQWRTDYITLPPAVFGQQSVMFSFENRSYWGGQLYIDNIHVPASPIQGVQNVAGRNENLVIYPNPNNGSFQLAINSQLPANSSVAIFNMLGQQVYYSGLVAPVTQISMNPVLGEAATGLYLYRVMDGSGNLLGQGKFVIAK